MQIAWLRHEDNWQDVKNAAMNTVGKDKGVYPTAAWKKKILLAEHSPIRLMQFAWKWSDLPYWVSVHIVRHKIGIEHFVSTQRTDRTGVDRTERPQNAPVLHQCQANAQALITISRKRLCSGASAETRQAWQLLKDEIAKVEPELASCMVRECVYRGFCPEMNPCEDSASAAAPQSRHLPIAARPTYELSGVPCQAYALQSAPSSPRSDCRPYRRYQKAPTASHPAPLPSAHRPGTSVSERKTVLLLQSASEISYPPPTASAS